MSVLGLLGASSRYRTAEEKRARRDMARYWLERTGLTDLGRHRRRQPALRRASGAWRSPAPCARNRSCYASTSPRPASTRVSLTS